MTRMMLLTCTLLGAMSGRTCSARRRERNTFGCTTHSRFAHRRCTPSSRASPVHSRHCLVLFVRCCASHCHTVKVSALSELRTQWPQLTCASSCQAVLIHMFLTHLHTTRCNAVQHVAAQCGFAITGYSHQQVFDNSAGRHFRSLSHGTVMRC